MILSTGWTRTGDLRGFGVALAATVDPGRFRKTVAGLLVFGFLGKLANFTGLRPAIGAALDGCRALDLLLVSTEVGASSVC